MKVFSKEKYIERMGVLHYNTLPRVNGKCWVDIADGMEVQNGWTV